MDPVSLKYFFHLVEAAFYCKYMWRIWSQELTTLISFLTPGRFRIYETYPLRHVIVPIGEFARDFLSSVVEIK